MELCQTDCNNKVTLMWNVWTERSIYPCHVSSNDTYAMMYCIFFQFVVKYVFINLRSYLSGELVNRTFVYNSHLDTHLQAISVV